MLPRLFSRSRLACAVVAVLLIVMPRTLLAYHFLGKWATLPITVIADSDPGFAAKVSSATLPWNNVATAKNIFSAVTTSPFNFAVANYKKAGGWGHLTDGKLEIVCDTDGTVYTELELVIGETTGATFPQIDGGVISDAFFVLDCKSVRPTADQVSTMVHEFGHMLGLAHSSVYQQLDDAIDPITSTATDIPTMHPFFEAGGETLEADDIAGVSDLYPDTTFATALGSIEGTVTRCGTGEAVSGVNVRAVNVSTSSRRIQVTRYTAFDGNGAGRYRINGLPPGTYKIIIEALSFPKRGTEADYPLKDLTSFAPRIDNDFAAEYLNPPNEDDCSEELPDTAVNQTVTAGGALTAKNFKTNPIELAFVVDDTGSMSEEIAGVRKTLTNLIDRLKAFVLPDSRLVADATPFPNTAIITFKDNVTVRKVSRDPAVLQAIVNGLSASGGGDCPEHANDAMLAAGKMLRKGGTAMLFTDADSHSSGASAAAVSSFYIAKNLKLSSLLSGTCGGSGFSTVPIDEEDGASLMDPRFSQNSDDELAAPLDHRLPGPTLGAQSAIETYSSIATATGGLFVAIPGVNTSSTEATRYVNVGTNIAVSASLPTVSLLLPGDGSPGNTLDIAITGTNTNFQAASTLAFSGTGITINSKTVTSATAMTANVTIAAGATLGFRDVTVTSLVGAATEVATGVGAFNITAASSSPRIVSVVPALGGRGTTVSVTIRGSNTTFGATSTPIFCTSSFCSSTSSHDPKITLNSKTVVNATTIVANITIAADATISYRNVAVVTGSEVATESVTGPFLIGAAPLAIPQLTAVSPASVTRGQTLNLSITGANTNFVSGTSVAALSGTGITVNSTTVTSPTAATANITIAAGATLGFRDVSMTTGTEVAVLLSGLTLVDPPTTIVATPAAINIGAIKANAAAPLQVASPGQAIAVTFTGPGAAWTVSSNQSWIQIVNGSGTGAGRFTIVIADPTNLIGGATTLSAVVTISAPSLGLATQVPVTLRVKTLATATNPFGAFDTPAGGGTLNGSFAVTGWALDDIGIDRVEIWRDRAPGETTAVYPGPGPGTGKIFIASPPFISGARADVESAYPTEPFADRAGWGYLLLSYGLYNQGNGPFTLYAFAFDVDGHSVTLGTKSINVSNATAVTPFGSIDVPSPGQTVSGAFFNFGWALTPNATPTCTVGASGVQVSVDSAPLVPVSYGDLRPDIAAGFPGFSNGAGAGGAYFLDTTGMTNGTHQIGWFVVDSCGRAEGIGSRFFNVLNSGSTTTPVTAAAPASSAAIDEVSAPVAVRRSAGTTLLDPNRSGTRVVPIAQGERVEVVLPPSASGQYQGYHVVNGERRALPLGSSLDAAQGIFYWQPDAAFLGAHDLDFVAGASTVRVRVIIGTSVQAVIDAPGSGTVRSSFVVAGWAIDEAATSGTGIDTVHVWAYPASGGDPIFLGVAEVGGSRPDIAALFGEQFNSAAYDLAVEDLPAGDYEIVVYPHSAVSGDFRGSRTVSVRVR